MALQPKCLKPMNKRIDKLIKDMGRDFLPEERETSVLYCHSSNTVYFETSDTHTARRWYKTFKDSDDVTIDDKTDTFRMSMPIDYCRTADYVVKAKHRL